MNIYELNKMLSSKTKSRLITHFWSCACKDHTVSHMAKKLKTSQPNISKHIAKLLKTNILTVYKKGRESFYSINIEWKKEWENIIGPQLLLDENKEYVCNCSLGRKND